MSAISNGSPWPPGFAWGVATAAYQIEGAASSDGRGVSIWDTFSRTPGRVADGHTGDVACDHYHRWPEDLDLLKWLGVGAYRFSVSWPRVQPGGRGPLSSAGVAFYDRLVDGLLERGIEPWVSLYHWDLPQELEDAGGWPARDTAERFAEYAAAMHLALGDRVKGWITINEPWCVAFLGYASGVHAPGRRDGAAAVRAAHHALLGHGLGMAAMREQGADSVGISLNLYEVRAATTRPQDEDAARRVDGLQNRLFLDPVLRGRYPADVLGDLAEVSDFSHIQPGDLGLIGAPLDFLGVNYYSSYTVSQSEADKSGPSPWVGSPRLAFEETGRPQTAMGWDVDSEGLRKILRRVTREYGPLPIYITENGAAYTDAVHNGVIDDRERVVYLASHLEAAAAAISDGVDLRGYFLWSLLDNFEWAMGYTRRFGIIHVDFETQLRTPKTTARWYREVTAGRRPDPPT